MRKSGCVLSVMLMCLAAGLARGQGPDPWTFVDMYAPVMQVNTVGVKVTPTVFGDDSITCAYVNIKPGNIFQYWFYYTKDIRLDAQADAAIKLALQQADRSQPQVNLEPYISKAFHEHDWELVEVTVPKLGDVPSRVSFGIHGTQYDLVPNAWPLGATMQSNQVVMKIVTDMHASYPGGPWSPALAGFANPQANAEFAIILAKELNAGFNPLLGTPPPYTTINFAGKCRRFSARMLSIHQLEGYPYELPWDRGYRY